MDAININDFAYELPADKIALYPLEDRDKSKLLVYRKGNVSHHTFNKIAELLPSSSLLFFNNTKVIPARLLLRKDSGAEIEIFLLNPVVPSTLLADAMQARDHVCWKCTIGNLKRWPDGLALTKQVDDVLLVATLLDREQGVVKFSWKGHQSFADVIRIAGEVPLPPYLKRKANQYDTVRYQTVYANEEGAVAAPTAGLHFTESILDQLDDKNIVHDYVTLHVSAGTFQPIKVINAREHQMHEEQILITRKNIENLLADKFVVAVGTTSLRTLESVYWYGVKLIRDPSADFLVTQHEPYQDQDLPEVIPSLKAVINRMDQLAVDHLVGASSIYIMPGYAFRICKGLITNFHQPGSTLILLVAAFIGKDWEVIYKQALEHNYRFLSYGDSSLLIP